MPIDSQRPYSEYVVVLAPTARDAEVTRTTFDAAGIDCIVENSPAAVAELIRRGIGALVLTDFSLAAREPTEIFHALAQQPPWSDVAVLALCRNVEEAPALQRVLQRLSNVTVLDRPTSRNALVSSVQAALRGRRWQYRIRDQIRELTVAEEALRRADRRKDEFLATLAHELRNPLAPIKTGIYLLSTVDPAGEQLVNLQQMMDRQLTQLVKLIDDLLEISRLSMGRIVLQRERLDLRTVVKVAIESCQPILDAAQHDVSVSLPESEVWVRGDSARLAQAISNLLNNAAKYTLSGGKIDVVLRFSEGQASLSVTDNGLGIPPDMLDTVFQMFTQVNRTLDRSQGGLGIGLALVRNLVELHGGSVSALSQGENQGSTFTIRLPAAVHDSEDRASNKECSSPSTSNRSMRILVVDDNVDAADSLGMLLRSKGHDVQVVYSGAAALHAASAFQPEAIFCDIGMRGMGGMEVAAKLREDIRFAPTVLVALTGWGTEGDLQRTRAAGFDFHLTKPASLESVQSILSKV